MTPQLFINYKLKSVAHLPWRMLTYKALNTFIDDLFAFVIKMPMLYRIGCFRDGLLLCVLLLYEAFKQTASFLYNTCCSLTVSFGYRSFHVAGIVYYR